MVVVVVVVGTNLFENTKLSSTPTQFYKPTTSC